MNTISLQSIDSTNTYAKEQLAQGAATPLLVTAEQQLCGRGQYERNFSSPIGGAYFSLGIRPEVCQQDVPLITLATGVACARYLEELSALQVKLKWPNDLFVEGKKIGGILCESIFKDSTEMYTVIGVGVNINTRVNEYPTELQPLLTSVREHIGQIHCVETVIGHFVDAIIEHVSILSRSKEKIIAQWQEHDYLHERPVEHVAGDVYIRAKGKGILPNGRYRVVDDSGQSHDVMSGQLRPV